MASCAIRKCTSRWPQQCASQSAPAFSSTNEYDRNETSNSIDRQQRRLNLSLFGPPGSGKGSYGKHFAQALEIPLVTTSDVLRKLRPDLVQQMSHGKLVDDKVVGETVLEGLRNMQLRDGGYILDGFPRTLRQVALMEDTWPESLKVQTVVHLEVPDFVCSTKLLGRRGCSKCGKSYNVHGVNQDGWKMPPHLPREGHVCDSATKDDISCDFSIKRDDDVPKIVEERLKVYHQNADPILDYIRDNTFQGKGNNRCSKNNGNTNQGYRLITLTPYHGFKDLPILIEKLCRRVDVSKSDVTE